MSSGTEKTKHWLLNNGLTKFQELLLEDQCLNDETFFILSDEDIKEIFPKIGQRIEFNSKYAAARKVASKETSNNAASDHNKDNEGNSSINPTNVAAAGSRPSKSASNFNQKNDIYGIQNGNPNFIQGETITVPRSSRKKQ